MTLQYQMDDGNIDGVLEFITELCSRNYDLKMVLRLMMMYGLVKPIKKIIPQWKFDLIAVKYVILFSITMNSNLNPILIHQSIIISLHSTQ